MNNEHNQSSTVPDTSPSLLLRIRNPDDKESWSSFERIYGTVIRRYCRSWNLQPADIDDITQDVMNSVATSIRKFDYDPTKGRFRGWLGTITSNKIKRFLTRETRHQKANKHDPEGQFHGYADPDSNWVNTFCEVVLKEACSIGRLEFEVSTWQCFELTWMKRQKPEDVAQTLGIATHSVYVNKSRVLKRLEQIIRDLAEDLAYQYPHESPT